MPIGRRGALRLAGVAGLGLLGAAGSAALAQADVVPGRSLMWRSVDGLVPDHSPVHAGGPVERLTFRSRFRRGVDTEMIVMAPPGTDPARPRGLPVCLLLHGRGADAGDALRLNTPGFLADTVAAGVPPFAVVAVDGGSSGYWHPRADGTNPLATLTEEVLPRLAATGYATTPADPFAVVGWSMGGYGALLLGETVGASRAVAVGALSPAIWRRFEDSRAGAFDDRADFARHDVLAGAGRLTGVAVRVDCALGDPFLPAARDLVAALHPTPEGGFGPGSHNHRYWHRQLPEHLALAGRSLAGQARPTGS